MIVDGCFYLLARETPQDVCIRLKLDRRGAWGVRERAIKGAAWETAKSLGFRGAELRACADSIVADIKAGLAKEKVIVR